jgi:hypothetical protein
MPEDFVSRIGLVGALCFGVVIGWVTSRTLRRAKPGGLTDIATVIGAVGGAAITALFRRETGEFGAYCVGLLFGFFTYLIVAIRMVPAAQRDSIGDWLGSEPPLSDTLAGSYARRPESPPENRRNPDDSILPPP